MMQGTESPDQNENRPQAGLRRVRFALPEPESDPAPLALAGSGNGHRHRLELDVSKSLKPPPLACIVTHHRQVRFDSPPKPQHISLSSAPSSPDITTSKDSLLRAVDTRYEGDLAWKVFYDPGVIEDTGDEMELEDVSDGHTSLDGDDKQGDGIDASSIASSVSQWWYSWVESFKAFFQNVGWELFCPPYSSGLHH